MRPGCPGWAMPQRSIARRIKVARADGMGKASEPVLQYMMPVVVAGVVELKWQRRVLM